MAFDTRKCPDPILHILKLAQIYAFKYCSCYVYYYQEEGYHSYYPVKLAHLMDEVKVLLPSLVIYQEYAH